MGDYPDPDEEYELMYADDLELLREMDDDADTNPVRKKTNPAKRSLDFSSPIATKISTTQNNIENNQNHNTSLRLSQSLQPLDDVLTPENISNQNILTPIQVSNQNILTPINENVSNKRTAEDLFGDINDIDFDNIELPSKRQKTDEENDMDLISKIIEGRKLRQMLAEPSSRGYMDKKPDFSLKDNLTLNIPRWPFVPFTKWDGERVYVRLESEESWEDSLDRITETFTLQGTCAATWEEARKILEAKNQQKESNESVQEVANDIEENDLWVERYRPKSYIDLLSEEPVNRALLHWLHLWDKVVFKKDVKTKEPHHRNTFSKRTGQFQLSDKWKGKKENEPEVDEDGRPHHKVALLCGPPGVGKTTLAHLLARLAGYRPVELNASDERSTEAFQTALQSATLMRSVLDADRRPNCLILDEIDGAPIQTVELLVKWCTASAGKKEDGKKKSKSQPLKRPVIAICNDLYATSLRPLRPVSLIVTVGSITAARLAARLTIVAQREKLRIHPRVISALAARAQGDIRAALHVLSFLKAKAKTQVNIDDVENASIGTRDNAKSMMQALQAIFTLNDNDPSAILKTIQAAGEYDRVIDGIFENYLSARSDSRLLIACETMSWLRLYDAINSWTMRHQNYSLYGMLPICIARCHSILATRQSIKVKFPMQAQEMYRKKTELDSIVWSVWRGSSASVATTRSALRLDILPLLPYLLSPVLRSANVQLCSENERKSLTTCAGAMCDYGLQYIQQRTPEGLYAFMLEPDVYKVAFYGNEDCLRPPPAIRQAIAREQQLEVLRRNEEMMSRMSSRGKRSIQAGTTKPKLVSEATTSDEVKEVKETRIPNHLQRLQPKLVVKSAPQMPLTNAEKQKQYRERMRLQNPEKYEIFKKKNAERNKNRKKIKDYDETGKAEEREKWRNRKNKHNNKDLVKANNDVIIEANMQNSEETNFATENLKTIVQNARLAEKRKMQRQWADERANYEGRIKAQNNKIKTLQKKINRFRKQNEYLMTTIGEMKKNELTLNNNERTPENQTPASKTNSFIEKHIPDIPAEIKAKVKKQLLNHNVLVKSLQTSYEMATTNTERDVLKRAINSDVIQKYKSKNRMAPVLGLKGKIRWTLNQKSKEKKNAAVINQLKKFYERDDVSTATAGKKECKTFKKNKQQIRYLLNTLTELYKKYRNEGGTVKLTTFKKYRPFYVRRPKISNRNTCACVKHENITLKCIKLKMLGIIEAKYFASNDPNKIIDVITSEFVCDLKSKDCAYGDCNNCENKKITLNWEGIAPSQNISWEEWQNAKHEYKDKNGEIKVTKKIVKSEMVGTVQELTDNFNEEMKKMKKHIYNIKHQYMQASDCLKSLLDTEVAMIIDFSENWVCKLATEIQSMHFGASKNQITIHTGMLYRRDQDPKAFATVSPNNEHGPEAIWAHLSPVLDFIKNEYPNVTTIHFFSDGPSTQYKQKKNFYLFSKTTKERGFPHSTWNFSESSHGKGAADGVGAAIKRKLDNYVSHKIDIPNALIAFNKLQESDTSVMIHYISEEEICKLKLPTDLKPVPKTMDVHQVINTEVENVIGFRCLSCFCTRPVNCECYDLKTHLLLPLPHLIKTVSQNSKPVEAEAVRKFLKRKKKLNINKVQMTKNVKKERKAYYNISESSDSEEVVIEYIETDDDIDDFLSDTSKNSTSTVNSEDSQSIILNEETGILFKKNTDYVQHKENITPNIIPGPSGIKILEDQPIVEGKYILVRFPTNKTTKYYVGQILEVNGINIKVKFMRRKSNGLFYWPQAEDILDMRTVDITKV